jgi:hypothetical protein
MVSEIQTIKYRDMEISYSINRTSRKTIGIVVEPDGKVIIKASIELEQQKILDTIYNKRKLIAEELKLTEEIKKLIPVKHELASGEKILLKNRLIRLKIHTYSDKRPKLTYTFKTVFIYVKEKLSQTEREEEIKQILSKWHKEKVINIISNRIEKYLKIIDCNPQEIKVRDQKIRGGSCTKDDIIIFNWKIVMAPISAIDYFVVHELCHLKESTHSFKFWAIVESLFPYYKKWEERLRIKGKNLELRL